MRSEAKKWEGKREREKLRAAPRTDTQDTDTDAFVHRHPLCLPFCSSIYQLR